MRTFYLAITFFLLPAALFPTNVFSQIGCKTKLNCSIAKQHVQIRPSRCLPLAQRPVGQRQCQPAPSLKPANLCGCKPAPMVPQPCNPCANVSVTRANTNTCSTRTRTLARYSQVNAMGSSVQYAAAAASAPSYAPVFDSGPGVISSGGYAGGQFIDGGFGSEVYDGGLAIDQVALPAPDESIDGIAIVAGGIGSGTMVTFKYEGGYNVDLFPSDEKTVEALIRAIEGVVQNLLTEKIDGTLQFTVRPIGQNSNGSLFYADGTEGTWTIQVLNVENGKYEVQIDHPTGFGDGDTEELRKSLEENDSITFDKGVALRQKKSVGELARTWTNDTGREVTGTVLDLKGDWVKFRRSEDQKMFTAKIEMFSQSDQRLIRNSFDFVKLASACLLYTSPSPRDQRGSRMPSSA